MTNDDKSGSSDDNREIIVKASTIDGVLDILDVEAADSDSLGDGNAELHAELEPVVGTLLDALDGLRAATREDARGRSRKTVRAYADREDVPGEWFGRHLRVLEYHGIAERDGKRWRLAADPEDG